MHQITALLLLLLSTWQHSRRVQKQTNEPQNCAFVLWAFSQTKKRKKEQWKAKRIISDTFAKKKERWCRDIPVHALLCSKTENGYWENEAREHYTRQQLMNACLLCNCVWLGNRRHYYHSKRQGWPDKTAAKHCGKTQRIRITESGAECSAHYWQIMVVGCRCYIVFRRVQYKKGAQGAKQTSGQVFVELWCCDCACE